MTVQPAIQIVGAGPAGLAAALTATRCGGRAVVFEGRDGVGRRFHDDFQGLENWTTQGDVLDELASFGIEPDFDATPFREGVFFDPLRRPHPYRSERPFFYLVHRGPGPGTLDRGLERQALARGVEIRFNTPREHLPEGGVVARGPRGVGGIVVGYVFDTDMADGIYGAISDHLAPKGYAYLLVHGGRGTVASCLFDRFHDEAIHLERTVELFREEVGLAMSSPRRFGGTGDARIPRAARRGRLLFAGEAAGFQDPLWGFGMRYAMVSGGLAARALVDGKPASYDRLWKRRLRGFMRTAVVNRWAYERLGDDRYAPFLRRIARSPDPREWLRRFYAPALWKSLLYPLAARGASASVEDSACAREGCECTWCRCHRAVERSEGHEPVHREKGGLADA